jgi:hypothetical protein
LSSEIIHFSIVDATVPFEVPFVFPTEGLGIVETLEEHFQIMNLEVDIPEDYVGPLTGMDFAKCPTADSLTNVYNVERNIQCSSALQASIREITTQINQAKNNCVQPVTPVCHKTLALLLRSYDSAKANYLVCSFNNGFRIGFQGDRHIRASPNLKSGSEFPENCGEKTCKRNFLR